ncbi:MAG: TetR/AcrR family transcriptional regulator, partial [Pseudomonadota bacterium]
DQHGFSAALEQAVRDWARLDQTVLAKVRHEDRHRIKQIQRCFIRFGYAKNEALVRARILYFAQIGYYAMHMEESMQDRLAMTEQYYASFTGRKLNTRVAKAFAARYQQD